MTGRVVRLANRPRRSDVYGNKRTAISSAALFLQLNGRFMQTSNQELERFTLHVVNSNPLLEKVAGWFETNAVIR